MSNILNTLGLSFNQLITLIIVVVGSVVAIRLTITFDLNKHIENRKSYKLNKLRNACTHHQVFKEGDSYGLQSMFISPPGTSQWQCQQCQGVRYFGDGELERMTNYNLGNFEEFTKRQKKFQKMMKKSKLD